MRNHPWNRGLQWGLHVAALVAYIVACSVLATAGVACLAFAVDCSHKSGIIALGVIIGVGVAVTGRRWGWFHWLCIAAGALIAPLGLLAAAWWWATRSPTANASFGQLEFFVSAVVVTAASVLGSCLMATGLFGRLAAWLRPASTAAAPAPAAREEFFQR